MVHDSFWLLFSIEKLKHNLRVLRSKVKGSMIKVRAILRNQWWPSIWFCWNAVARNHHFQSIDDAKHWKFSITVKFSGIWNDFLGHGWYPAATFFKNKRFFYGNSCLGWWGWSQYFHTRIHFLFIGGLSIINLFYDTKDEFETPLEILLSGSARNYTDFHYPETILEKILAKIFKIFQFFRSFLGDLKKS